MNNESVKKLVDCGIAKVVDGQTESKKELKILLEKDTWDADDLSNFSFNTNVLKSCMTTTDNIQPTTLSTGDIMTKLYNLTSQYTNANGIPIITSEGQIITGLHMKNGCVVLDVTCDFTREDA